jgi:hypothetical protein
MSTPFPPVIAAVLFNILSRRPLPLQQKTSATDRAAAAARESFQLICFTEREDKKT